jgi:hypothetical protein
MMVSVSALAGGLEGRTSGGGEGCHAPCCHRGFSQAQARNGVTWTGMYLFQVSHETFGDTLLSLTVIYKTNNNSGIVH